MKSVIYVAFLGGMTIAAGCRSPEGSDVKDVSSASSALQPPQGTKGGGTAWLPACGESVACPQSLDALDKGCAATDGTNVFKSLEGGNNCSDGLTIQAKICSQGLDPATFQSACFVKDGTNSGGSGTNNPGNGGAPSSSTAVLISFQTYITHEFNAASITINQSYVGLIDPSLGIIGVSFGVVNDEDLKKVKKLAAARPNEWKYSAPFWIVTHNGASARVSVGIAGIGHAQ